MKQAPEAVVPRGLERRHQVVKINKVARHCVLVDMEAYDKVVM